MSTSLLNQQAQPSLLRNALVANAIFSSLSGACFILFTQPFSTFLGWSQVFVLPLIGVGLLGFAFFIYTVTKTKELNNQAVKSIILADLAWVGLSVLVIISAIVPLTLEGKWAVGLLADVVATFAFLQYLGLRRINK